MIYKLYRNILKKIYRKYYFEYRNNMKHLEGVKFSDFSDYELILYKKACYGGWGFGLPVHPGALKELKRRKL